LNNSTLVDAWPSTARALRC